MECPNGHKNPARSATSVAGGLEKVLFHNTEVDYCLDCLGIWFDKEELTYAKDDRDKQLNWLDFDIWRHKGNFEVMLSNKRCPVCRIPFVQVNYDESKVKIDFCKNCEGIWLDRGEFKQIMVYLKNKADYEILHRYTKNLAQELWEVFAGPQKIREELFDFLMLIKLFNYKFIIQHPHLKKLIEELPK